MNLVLEREKPSLISTQGSLYVNGMWECFTLEPCHVVIPIGMYSIGLYESPRFGRQVPIIENVPGHSFVEMHTGNKAKDTHGCILVGQREIIDDVLDSKLAFEALFPKIQKAIQDHEGVVLRVENAEIL